MHVLLLACALALALPAAAQRRGDENAWPMLAGKYDADGDGAITRDEYPRGERGFQNLDRDGDGRITAADFAGGRRGARGMRRDTGRMVAARIAAGADADGDGEVTAAEWQQHLAGLDADGDGSLDRRELADALPGMGRMRARLARVLDTDGDGDVRVSEVAALFAKLDRDGDGTLRADELPRERGSEDEKVPAVGDIAPDFDLPLVRDMQTTVELSSFRGRKPVALIFGSYT